MPGHTHRFSKSKGTFSWVAGETPGSLCVVKGRILLSERPGFRSSSQPQWLGVTSGHGLPMPLPTNEALKLTGSPPGERAGHAAGQALHMLATTASIILVTTFLSFLSFLAACYLFRRQ